VESVDTGKRQKWIADLVLSALIVGVAVAVYWSITGTYFVSDDFLWHSFFKNSIGELYEKLMLQHRGEIELAYFRPTLIFSYQIDYHLFGDSPFAFHLINNLLHAANAVMIYFLARKVGLGRFGSFAGAVFFAVYPANAEAVDWISGRGDVESVTWILVSLLLWCGYREKRSTTMLVLSAVAFIIAIGAKESAAAMIFVLPVIDWLLNIKARAKREGRPGYEWAGWIVFAIIVAATLGFRWWLFGDIGGPRGPGNTAKYFDFTFAQAWSTLVYSNLKIMFTPVSRTLWPEWPDGWKVAIIAIGVILGLVLAGAIVFSAIGWKRSRRSLVVIVGGILWILIMMLPVVPLAPIFDSLIRARYLYTPAIGLALWLGVSMGMLWRGGIIRRAMAIVLLAGMVTVSGYSIYRYNKVWQRSSEISEEINEVMAENTRFLESGGTVFQVNFPRHYKGTPCAPYRYGSYLEFLYGYKNVRTLHLEKLPRDIPFWWGALRRTWRTPAAAFLWDNPSKSVIALQPIDPDYLERRDREEED
jgi:hypothetical protein